MTIMEMLIQGNFAQLAGMGLLFIFWVILLSKIGSGIAARSAAEKEKESKVYVPPSAENKAITAAITAAVNEYRKK